MATAVLSHSHLSGLGSLSSRQIQCHRDVVFTNADDAVADHANAKARFLVAKHGSAELEHESAIEMHHDTNSVVQVRCKGDLTVDGALTYASVQATGGSTFSGGIAVTGGDGVFANNVQAQTISSSGRATLNSAEITIADLGKSNGVDSLNVSTTGVTINRDVDASQADITAKDVTVTSLACADQINCSNVVASGQVQGTVLFASAMAILNGPVNCSSTLSLTGAATVGSLTTDGAITASGAADLDSLTVSGSTAIACPGVTSTGDITAAGQTISGQTMTCTDLTAGGAQVNGVLGITGHTTAASIAASGNVSGANLSCTGGAMNSATIATTGDATIGGALQCASLNVTGATTTISSSEVVIADRSLTIGNDETADQTEAAARSAAIAAGGMALAFGQYTDSGDQVQQFGGEIKYEVDSAGKDADRFVVNNALRCQGDLSFASRLAPASRMVWRYRTGADKAAATDKSTVELWLVTDETAGFSAPNRMLTQFHDHAEV